MNEVSKCIITLKEFFGINEFKDSVNKGSREFYEKIKKDFDEEIIDISLTIIHTNYDMKMED